MAYYRSRDPRQVAGAVAVALAVAAGAGKAHAASHHHHGHPAALPGHAAQAAVVYAKAQLGKPYVWGGTGPGAFDCSGLVMMAYQSAGVNIPRTSQEQWAGLRHVPWRDRRFGDLVFFAGSDGTPAAPGHVGLVLGAHSMIEAYAPGVPVRVSQYGTPQSAPGDGTPVGFAVP